MRLGERRPYRAATAAWMGIGERGADLLLPAPIPESAVLYRLCAAPRDGDIDEKDMTAADVSTDYLCPAHGGNPVMSPGTRPEWGVAWWVAFLVCKPVLILVRRRDWRGLDQIPPSGGVVLAANHVSHVDRARGRVASSEHRVTQPPGHRDGGEGGG